MLQRNKQCKHYFTDLWLYFDLMKLFTAGLIGLERLIGLRDPERVCINLRKDFCFTLAIRDIRIAAPSFWELPSMKT